MCVAIDCRRNGEHSFQLADRRESRLSYHNLPPKLNPNEPMPESNEKVHEAAADETIIEINDLETFDIRGNNRWTGVHSCVCRSGSCSFSLWRFAEFHRAREATAFI